MLNHVLIFKQARLSVDADSRAFLFLKQILFCLCTTHSILLIGNFSVKHNLLDSHLFVVIDFSSWQKRRLKSGLTCANGVRMNGSNGGELRKNHACVQNVNRHIGTRHERTPIRRLLQSLSSRFHDPFFLKIKVRHELSRPDSR